MRISDWSSDVCSSDLVTLLYHSWFSDCVMEGDRVSHVIVQNKAGRVAYAADIFIDCTGDADLVRAAGFPTTKGDVLQPATLWFQLGGVDTDALAHLLRDAVAGMLPVSEDRKSVVSGKMGTVRVDLGVSGIINKKKRTIKNI